MAIAKILSASVAAVAALSGCTGSFITEVEQQAGQVDLTFKQPRLGGSLMRFLGMTPLSPCIFNVTITSEGQPAQEIKAKNGLCVKLDRMRLSHPPAGFEIRPVTLRFEPGRSYELSVSASIGQSNARFQAR